MKLSIRYASARRVDDFTIEAFINIEDFRAALDAHSPNLLIDYLNERYDLSIAHIDKPNNQKKGGCNGTL